MTDTETVSFQSAFSSPIILLLGIALDNLETVRLSLRFTTQFSVCDGRSLGSKLPTTLNHQQDEVWIIIKVLMVAINITR